jgi:hypothetical protein
LRPRAACGRHSINREAEEQQAVETGTVDNILPGIRDRKKTSPKNTARSRVSRPCRASRTSGTAMIAKKIVPDAGIQQRLQITAVP